ncbi:MAG TPA: fused MFS/spermidine synthase, partial [Rubrobacteraceae bacterium]|nr:fused MFS/spermidine synthase [Rubrobacteraceae bacterium]
GRSRNRDGGRSTERSLEDEQTSGRSGAGRFFSLRFLLDLALPLALGGALVALSAAVNQGYLDSLNQAANSLLNTGYFGRAELWQVLVGVVTGLACMWFAYVSVRPIRFGLGIAAIIVAVTFVNGETQLYEDRSFFGVYKVTERPALGGEYHALVVGDTNHGAQVVGPQPPKPLGYHDPSGPFGQLFELLPSETSDESPIAVLGLGAGVMSCYTEPGQQMTYYEIDPVVEQIARDENLFTYLRDCPGEYDVILGDARLRLAEAEDASYGIIIGEAFSSDAIPVHMLTREATDLYLDKLNENGVIVHHISNRHLQLEPVVGDLAREEGLVCYEQYDDDTASARYKLASQFVVMARDEEDLGNVARDARWRRCETSADTDKVWTDDFSNLLSTFKWG